MFQFPFGTMHQLNLDWFLQQWQQLRQDWIDEEQHIEDSMQDVYDARDAAIQAKDDAVSAKNDAESAQAGVHADALMAEGFAVGEQNGTPVGPGSPYYQVNAKFYSTNAGTYRYLSEAYARGTMGGTPVDPGDAGYEDNSKYYKEQADLDAQSASDDAAFAAADALKAEGWAVGEQNGVPVSSGDPYYENNAKYYAGEAQQDKEDADTFKDAANQAALRSEGYALGTQNGSAVGSDSPYYENNAFYYFSNTANIDGENAQKMISANEENSITAANEYAKGELFRLAGELYEATAAIAIGDTITVGTNCKKTTVEELMATPDEMTGLLKNILAMDANVFDVSNYGILSGAFFTNGESTIQSYSSGRTVIYMPCTPNTVYIAKKTTTDTPTRFVIGFTTELPQIGVTTYNGVAAPDPNVPVGSDIYITAVSPSNAKYIVCWISWTLPTLSDEINSFRLYSTPGYMTMIAPILPTFTADTSLVANDFRIIENSLYRITSPIANGGTITPGTNATKTTITEILKALLNA